MKRLGVGNFAGEGDFSRSVTFSPDGELLFVGQYNGTGRLFSTDTWRQVGLPLESQTARITFPEFTPDGRTLITAAADGTVVLWDVETHKMIGSPLQLEPNAFTSAALSPDGSHLFAISTAGKVGVSLGISRPRRGSATPVFVAGREHHQEAEWEPGAPRAGPSNGSAPLTSGQSDPRLPAITAAVSGGVTGLAQAALESTATSGRRLEGKVQMRFITKLVTRWCDVHGCDGRTGSERDGRSTRRRARRRLRPVGRAAAPVLDRRVRREGLRGVLRACGGRDDSTIVASAPIAREPSPPTGFDWVSATIGATAAAGLSLVLAAGLGIRRRTGPQAARA